MAIAAFSGFRPSSSPAAPAAAAVTTTPDRRRRDHADHRHVQRLRLHDEAPRRSTRTRTRTSRSSTPRRPPSRATPAANYFAKLGKGGLADIEAVEIDWFAEAMQYSDLLAEAPDSVKGRWLDWKEDAATDADGRLVGFGTDIGPQGHLLPRPTCSRPPASPPTPGRASPTLFDGDWETLPRRGRPVQGGHRQADDRLGQLGAPGHREPDRVHVRPSPDGTVIATDNPEIEDAYNLVAERGIPNSAYPGQWSDDWFASMANGEFAAMLCPGWMLGVISGNAPDVTGWDIAERLPERRRQLGWFVPDRSRERRERRGGSRRSPTG